MFRNLFVAALIAALAGGIAFSIIQQIRLSPLIHAAESLEAPTAETHVHEGETEPHSHDADAWMPQDGAERIGYTVLANLLAAAGYALVVGAVSVFVGLPITAANGVLWGLGGYATFMLAPSFGLPPVLPGMATADTLARQVWWWGTAVATAAGLLAYAKWRMPWTLVLAAVLIAMPHVIGAPQPPAGETSVPAGLAAGFVVSVLFANAVMWIVLGLAFGHAVDWLARRAGVHAAKGAHA